MLPLLLVLFTACEKEGGLNEKPITLKPFTMTGFALKPLEQHFDGVKVRELYGNVAVALSTATQQIAFDKDQTSMELKGKSNGETFYQQTFNINDATNTVPPFYFDGIKILPRYDHPNPVGKEYKANFYFDFPKDSGAVDVMAEILEYYLDRSTGKNLYVVLNVTRIPVATNLEPGKWSDYVVLTVLPVFTKSRSDARFSTYICVKKAGSANYYINDHIADLITKMPQNSFPLKFPVSSTTTGLVQSYFIGKTKQDATVSLRPQQDLVQLFP